MDNVIDGRKLAAIHEQRLIDKLRHLNFRPKIVSILVGDDEASLTYTKMKQKKAAEVGIDFDYIKFPETEQFQNVAMTIVKLNQDPRINGIMVQLPLPGEFLRERTTDDLLGRIDPQKDVDGLRVDSPFLPATVRGVISILEDENVEVAGKFFAVLGKGQLVGKPIAKELKKRGALIGVIDSKTPNTADITRRADVIISAVGKPNLVTGEMVKEGVVVIDVGITRLDNGRLVGDVDFGSVSQKASKITPVPGGVGPMTVVSLMENVVESAERRE